MFCALSHYLSSFCVYLSLYRCLSLWMTPSSVAFYCLLDPSTVSILHYLAILACAHCPALCPHREPSHTPTSSFTPRPLGSFLLRYWQIQTFLIKLAAGHVDVGRSFHTHYYHYHPLFPSISLSYRPSFHCFFSHPTACAFLFLTLFRCMHVCMHACNHYTR